MFRVGPNDLEQTIIAEMENEGNRVQDDSFFHMNIRGHAPDF